MLQRPLGIERELVSVAGVGVEAAAEITFIEPGAEADVLTLG